MKVIYPDISKIIGYNYRNTKEPFYLKRAINFVAYWDKAKRKAFHIPMGFTSDGCTIPKILQWILGCPHTPEYLPASIIHDFFVKNKHLIDRESASDIFEYILLVEGVDADKAKYMRYWMNLYQKYVRRWK